MGFRVVEIRDGQGRTNAARCGLVQKNTVNVCQLLFCLFVCLSQRGCINLRGGHGTETDAPGFPPDTTLAPDAFPGCPASGGRGDRPVMCPPGTGRVHLNRVPLLIRGVNRHEHCPERGHAVTRDSMVHGRRPGEHTYIMSRCWAALDTSVLVPPVVCCSCASLGLHGDPMHSAKGGVLGNSCLERSLLHFALILQWALTFF